MKIAFLNQFHRFSFVFLGNILEHHDKALFSLLIPFIGQEFFENSDPVSVLFSAYGALFIGLLMRPLGAILFGLLGDRWGRMRTMSLTILGMSIATFGIGCLPSYQKIGFWAPIFITGLRAMQNFFAAGETNAAAVYAIEHSREPLKPLIGSFFETSTIIGILLASGELAIMSYMDCLDWWPVLFCIAGGVGLIGLFFRTALKESEEFTPYIVNKRQFVKEMYSQTKLIVAITMAAGFSSATYVMSITFINSFLTLTSHVTFQELAHINFLLLTLDAFLLPVFGYMALRVGCERVMFFATLSLSIFSVPLFLLLESGSLFSVLFVRIVIVTVGAAFAACFRSWAQQLILPHQRCTILNVSSSAANLLVEGPLILASLWAFQYSKWIAVPGIFLSLTALGALWALNLAHSARHFSEDRALFSK
ncbi:hypothetical protein PHSC3_000267 [Chlamydiales bacterium STE3]|nr:hypothetical protein PHSC3_000267 [Chlamydiales bacterium STE3]